jgi:hypothetical protein
MHIDARKLDNRTEIQGDICIVGQVRQELAWL